MNNGANTKTSGRKKVSILLLILLILGLITTVLLASLLNGMSKKKKRNYVPIDNNTSSSVSSGEGDADEGEFRLVHSKKIFCSSYKNGKGKVTVLSDDGKKVIAPGTSWNYSFSLHNDKSIKLRYTMRMEAVVEGLDKGLTLPVVSRVKGPRGWLTKDGANYTPVMDLNKVVENGVLSPNTIADYKLSWQWPFESGDDELDTLLGDTAANDHDITLYINIYVYACEETDEEVQGGDPIPSTGDNFSVGFWLATMIISMFAFIAVLANARRRDDYQM